MLVLQSLQGRLVALHNLNLVGSNPLLTAVPLSRISMSSIINMAELSAVKIIVKHTPSGNTRNIIPNAVSGALQT